MNDEKSKQTPGEDAGENGDLPEDDAATPEQGEGEVSGWRAGELEALKEENADLKDRLLRAAAEMENLRRRTERDKSDTARFAVSNFARDTLTIADNIARAIAHVPEDAAKEDPALQSFLDGIKVTERELMNVMERHGIARLDPKGERFDPNKHQAMFEVDDKDVAEGTIVEVVQAGYVIADRILRPAMVGIAKGGEKQKRSEKEAPEPAHQAANDDSAEADAETKGKKRAEPKKGAKVQKKNVGGKVDKSA
jgi:molecular chaperone GrpE